MSGRKSVILEQRRMFVLNRLFLLLLLLLLAVWPCSAVREARLPWPLCSLILGFSNLAEEVDIFNEVDDSACVASVFFEYLR